MENSINYAELLQITYSEYRTELCGDKDGFTFLLRNPERPDGDITVLFENGVFTLRFFSMDEVIEEGFGELVALVDELLCDESILFELYVGGEYVLGGTRSTEAIGIYRAPYRFARELADGDPALYTEIIGYLEKGNCHVRLRGWRTFRCRSIILAK